MLTIFKILDHDDYWLALQQILPDQKIRTTTCELTATLDCIRKQMEIGKPVKIRLRGAKRMFCLRPGDNESDFLKFALKHCPDFLRDFSGSNAAKVKLEFIA